MDKTANRIMIPGAAPVPLSYIKTLYLVRWDRQSTHRVRLNGVSLETTDGWQKNILITRFESAFKAQTAKLSDWLGVPIGSPED